MRQSLTSGRLTMTAYFRLFIRSLLTVVCVLVITPIMLVTWNLGARKATRAVMQIGFSFGAWAWNMRVRTDGILVTKRPLMLVSNHFSYLDLFALGSVAPAAFIAKSEIASWPLLGFMCRVSGCLFIDRKVSSTLQNKRAARSGREVRRHHLLVSRRHDWRWYRIVTFQDVPVQYR